MTQIDATRIALQNTNTAAAGQASSRRTLSVSKISNTVAQQVQTAKASASSITPQAQQFIQALSKQTRIDTPTKSKLIDVAALIDNFLNNPSVRSSMYRDLAGVGVFLGNQSGPELPAYSDLTGLRYYDAQRIQLGSIHKPAPTVQEVFDQVYQKLEQVVQEVAPAQTLDSALAQVAEAPAQRAQVAQFTSVSIDVAGVGTSQPAPQPQSSPNTTEAAPAPAPRVDTSA